MIKRVKLFQPQAKISEEEFRNYVEKSESEILRGISTIAVLQIIDKHRSEGIYGYQLLKNLEESTKNMLVIEEGTMYPLLKKLEQEGLINSEIQIVNGRSRKNYYITPLGHTIQTHLNGFFSKLVASMEGLLDIHVHFEDARFYYCPNCANKIDLTDSTVNFCEICGLSIRGYVNPPSKSQEA